MPTPTYAALLPETGYHWGVEPSSGPTAVTFSFMAADPQVYADFRPLTEGERAAARQALAEWSKVADIAFTEVEGDGQIRFAVGNLDGNAIGMTRWWSVSDDAGGAEIVSAEVWVDRSSPLAFEPGGSGLRVLLHEIGHAIGLQHPLENDPENSATEQTTLMAYAGHPDMPGVSAETPMVDDIAAVQSIYGPNLATEAGDSLYRWPDNPTFIQTLYDAGGIDTLDLSNLVRGAVADLRPGSLSSVGSYGAGPARDNLGIAHGTVIENAVGSAHPDAIVGNDAANRLQGGGGADLLAGGGGADQFVFASPADGGDAILDFTAGEDELVFIPEPFGFAGALLAGDSFVALTAPYDGANGTGGAWQAGRPALVYDAAANLYYDADGAAGGFTLLASLPEGTPLGADDLRLDTLAADYGVA
ncbi:MAG: M10 family metallopeptidase C-terminal domain-containing protein [Rhodospirillales bacterium]|nr:M10 family metallopeptidase C-terminal domain-containing protein [Rhodospirillales bacterium]